MKKIRIEFVTAQRAGVNLIIHRLGHLMTIYLQVFYNPIFTKPLEQHKKMFLSDFVLRIEDL
jgi:hypothetical protein